MSHVKQVFLKEVREMLRDRRTRSAAFFGPIFMMVFFVCGFGSVISNVGKEENQKVHVVKSDAALPLFKGTKIQVKTVDSVEQGKAMIRNGDARIVLEYVGAPPTSVGQQQIINAYFDPKQQTSEIAKDLVARIVAELNKQILKTTLVKEHIPATAAEPLKFQEMPVEVGGQGAGAFIVSMLPYLIVIWAFYGGFAMATDLVAGEKEKQTLETLLITPVTRTQIVMGKFFALMALCLCSSLSSLVGFALIAILKLPGSAFVLQGGLGLTPTAVIITLLVILPTVAMFASLLLSFSTYAKNSREAQTYISLASFVVVIPAAFSQLIGLTDAANQGWVNFVPVLNTANNIRNALLGKPDWMGVGITFAMSAAIALVLLSVVVRLFNREQVLTRV